MPNNAFFMHCALEQAQRALFAGEVPVGAVAVKDRMIIARNYNAPIMYHDPTAHAEIRVLREAAQRLGNYRLNDIDLYVTLEPCAMCYGAMIHARIARLFFGANDPKSGVLCGATSLVDMPMFNHHIQVVGGILSDECAAVLKSFFSAKRKLGLVG